MRAHPYRNPEPDKRGVRDRPTTPRATSMRRWNFWVKSQSHSKSRIPGCCCSRWKCR